MTAMLHDSEVVKHFRVLKIMADSPALMSAIELNVIDSMQREGFTKLKIEDATKHILPRSSDPEVVDIYWQWKFMGDE